MIDYSKNIEKLFSLGASRLVGEEVNYTKLGLSSDDTEELVVVALDDRLHYGDVEDENHLYAPIHAINTLSQFKIKEPFEQIFDLINRYEDDDYLAEAIVSYAKELDILDTIDSSISDGSLSTIAIDTLNKRLHKKVEEPKEKTIIVALEEVKEAKEIAIEPKEKAVAEVKIKKVEVKKEIIKPTIKIGRNEPCPCGSGKKYKKCCL
jgi:regulation of enolase protein 1 (concanavalin A-like superfamily)